MQEDDDNGLMKHQGVDTSILLRLFGLDGAGELEFKQFCTFMNNLQTEVIQIEFAEFSKGAPTITELDFARILLRYTFLNSEDYDNILERLQERIQEEKGITFEEFKDFCMFLNNLDDFQIAMRMYTLADKPISQVNCSLAKQQKYLLPNIFTKYFPGGVFPRCPHLHWQNFRSSHGANRYGWRVRKRNIK